MLRVIGLVIALPVAALGIGLLVAWIVQQIRGNPTAAAPQGGPAPSISAVATTPPPAAPRPAVAPADWVVESDPPAGLTYLHPPGWIRRTSLPEVLRFAPVSAGSTTPGVEGIGAGIEPNVDPSQALQQFATRAYGGQPQVQDGPITAVAGAHAGEQQEVVSYVRSGVPVRVVVSRVGRRRRQRDRPGTGRERSACASGGARGPSGSLGAAHRLIGSTEASEMLRSSVTAPGPVDSARLSRTQSL